MNGDLGTIYECLMKVKGKVEMINTKQIENHNMNKRDITILFGKIDKIENRLRCDVNAVEIKNARDDFKGHVRFIYTFLMVVVIGGIVLGLWVRSVMGGP